MTTFLKATEVPCRIEAGLSHEEAALLNLTENLERKDLNPVEEARGLARLFPEPTSLRTISEAVKRDSKWVHQRLRLLRLPDAVQQMIADGRLRLLDIEVLANLPTAAAQIDAATKIATERGRHGRRANRALAPHLRRRFRGVRTKHEISRQIGRLLGAGMVGLITRFGAWCAGYISDEEWNSDLQAEILRRRAAKGIEKIGAHLFSDSASEPAR